MRSFTWQRTLAGVVLATVLGPLAGCGPKPITQDPSATPHDVTLTASQLQHIRLYTVSSSSFRKSIDANGVVDFDSERATSVLTPFSGPVTRLLVSAGQHVKAGDTLALVQSGDFAAAISNYAKALVTARNARRLADVDRDLLLNNGLSQREEQQAQTDAANADADRDAGLQALFALNLDAATIKAVQAGRSTARVQAKIRSPISGTVVEKLITPGQLLQAGTTATFTIADLSKVWVQAQISDSDASSVRVGDAARIEAGVAATQLTGVVGNISALINPDTRSVVARIDTLNPGAALKKQMYVRVHIQSRQPFTGLLVPVSAILRDDDNLPFVYVQQAGGAFARKHVTLGDRTGDTYEISQGVHAGDRVVVDGGIFVQFMQNQ